MVLLLAALTVACTDDVPSYDLPANVDAIVDDASLAALEREGFVVHDGTNPPDITGTYAWDSTVRFYPDAFTICNGMGTYTLRADGTVMAEEMLTECDGGGSVDDAPIAGDGDCFTLFLPSEREFEGCRYRTIKVLSGCISPEGITDPLRASMPNEFLSPACDALVAERRLTGPGEFALRRETDGLMARVPEE